MVLEAYSYLKANNIEISSEDKASIQKRGKEIYSSLENERVSLGLSKFDNNVPVGVVKYFDATIEGLTDNISTGSSPIFVMH